jgi:CSLREA domain-containing protein
MFAMALAALLASAAADTPLAPGDLVPAALAVDPSPNGSSSDGNGVLEPGETAEVAPSWRNVTAAPIFSVAAASSFGGPGPAGLYAIPDNSAVYNVPAGLTASCRDSSNCYAVSLGTPAPRPAAHWDATVGETTAAGSVKTWMLHVGDSFSDVPRANIFYRFIEGLLHHGITGGCATPGGYCPTAPMTRDWMAAFVLPAKDGRYFIPPGCTQGATAFADVPATNPLCRFVEELARRGVVTGCGSGNYCPGLVVSREQMAVFILVTREGASYTPPPCVAGSETFQDVPASSPFCPWVEELVRRNVVAGCGSGNYCPTLAVSREQMSVFLSVTFGLSLYGVPPYMYLVNSANDVNDGACTPTHCSLREALTAANATPNPGGVREEIHFRIPGSGPQVITPLAGLPGIGQAVVIDGYTQPGAQPNTLDVGRGIDSVLQVDLDLTNTGALQVYANDPLLRGLAIRGSWNYGVQINAARVAVEGCYVGTDTGGFYGVGNAASGILITAPAGDARIGGTLPLQRNLISANDSSGVEIRESSRNLVQGNLIGTDQSGTADRPNGSGVFVEAFNHLSVANDNVVGGLEESAGNVISGNVGSAVATSGTVGASIAIVGGTRIQANVIGYTPDGAAPRLNGAGITIGGNGSWSTLIGGLTAAPAGNLIGSRGNGIDLSPVINGGPHDTRIEGNVIRGAFMGIRGYPNAGTQITSNVIGPNTSSGIFVDGGTIAIRRNSLFGNGGLGIDLAPAGVTPNDPGDGDTGPNELQNFPVITSAVSSTGGSITVVTGTISSKPGTAYVIEVFSGPVPGAAGYGEGRDYLGSTTVTTDGAGNATFTVSRPGPTPGVATATATDPAGNTSEFSQAVIFVQN